MTSLNDGFRMICVPSFSFILKNDIFSIFKLIFKFIQIVYHLVGGFC